MYKFLFLYVRNTVCKKYIKSIYNMYHDVLCVCTAVYVRMCMYRSPICTENGDATSQTVTIHKSSSTFHAMQNHIPKKNSA